MPQRHRTTEKRHRQNVVRHARNQTIRTHMRREIRKVREAIAGKDAVAAARELQIARRVIAKAASKGVVHRNTASRYIARLTKHVAALGA